MHAIGAAGMEPIVSGRLWAALLGLLAALLVLDLGLERRRRQPQTFASALAWSTGWTVVACLFGLWIHLRFGPRPGLEYLTGYVLERALSFDNLFVFLLLFDALAVPRAQRQRVLQWGIAGALVMRGLAIALGAALLARVSWMLLVFGAVLLAAGFRLLRRPEVRLQPGGGALTRLFRRFPLAAGDRGGRLVVREEGRLRATPLLLALLVVEATDVAFALDSIPAVFGITRSPFIAFSSNAFAVFGLRALFPVVEQAMRRLRYLGSAIGLMLVFVGAKMLAERWVEIPVGISLGVIAAVLLAALAASLRHPLPPPPADGPLHHGDGRR